MTVQNYLKEEDEDVQRARLEVKAFHDLIMEMTEQFAKTYELGMGEKVRVPKKHGDKRRDKENGQSEKGDGGGGNKGNPGAENPKLKPCVWCNKMHLLSKCPTLSE